MTRLRTFNETAKLLRRELLAERCEAGHWIGKLSNSALSTATAVSALSVCVKLSKHESEAENWSDAIRSGLAFLLKQQNSDGGFGDTDLSHSNIATSYLATAAMTLAAQAGFSSDIWTQESEAACQRYIETAGGLGGLRRRYGKDKTFVVPILTNLAIAGRVPWSDVPTLPFELAVVPQSMYRFVGLPVVSYAIPALVAMGQAKLLIHGGPLIYKWLRRGCIRRTMTILRRMQPSSGGYLEATPLTAFVVMSLAASGRLEHSVTLNGLRFLLDSRDKDGGWPIDTNLATWVTSLATVALTSTCSPNADVSSDMEHSWSTDALIDWQLSCQHQRAHPFTGADPGGWGWSDLSGAVPDGDDTPAAIIALLAQMHWHPHRKKEIRDACRDGLLWLMRLQNRDGGWPTFCRGWGKLPFDRSSVDLTAHAIRAFTAWQRLDDEDPLPGMLPATRRGHQFLMRQQSDDGSWTPLWFGNQDRADEDNPIYGTARVLLDGCGGLEANRLRRGIDYLIANQNADGGWGGGESVEQRLGTRSTIEETSLAVEAIA
ncbi:MAG: prenyltransferase/squalene oxidase repeat-containing protein, partial [Planctomycetota bacterium]